MEISFCHMVVQSLNTDKCIEIYYLFNNIRVVDTTQDISIQFKSSTKVDFYIIKVQNITNQLLIKALTGLRFFRQILITFQTLHCQKIHCQYIPWYVFFTQRYTCIRTLSLIEGLGSIINWTTMSSALKLSFNTVQ